MKIDSRTGKNKKARGETAMGDGSEKGSLHLLLMPVSVYKGRLAPASPEIDHL